MESGWQKRCMLIQMFCVKLISKKASELYGASITDGFSALCGAYWNKLFGNKKKILSTKLTTGTDFMEVIKLQHNGTIGGV
jgi:hypothetical protein